MTISMSASAHAHHGFAQGMARCKAPPYGMHAGNPVQPKHKCKPCNFKVSASKRHITPWVVLRGCLPGEMTGPPAVGTHPRHPEAFQGYRPPAAHRSGANNDVRKPVRIKTSTRHGALLPITSCMHVLRIYFALYTGREAELTCAPCGTPARKGWWSRPGSRRVLV